MEINRLINSTVDGSGNDYELHFEVKDSSLPKHIDIRFFSKISNKTQERWRTTLPEESVDCLVETLLEYLREKMKEKL